MIGVVRSVAETIEDMDEVKETSCEKSKFLVKEMEPEIPKRFLKSIKWVWF